MATNINLDEGKGILFPNDYATHPKAPTHRGFFKIDGVQLKIAAWMKESSNGTRFISLGIDNYESGGKTYPRESKPKDDDAIPF